MATKLNPLQWLIILVALVAVAWGLYNGLMERRKPGYITQPIEWSGPCPATITDKDGLPLHLDHCFLHKTLQRQVCEYRRTTGSKTFYLYVACGQ